jgi:hypothetical protein
MNESMKSLEGMKFTPGPWKVDVWDYKSHKDLIIQTETNRLAAIDWDEGKDNPYTIKKEVAEANARLIAAAPELYVACKQAQQEIKAMAAMLGNDHETCLSWNLIQNAIDKVEGD